MRISELQNADEGLLPQVAQVLVDGFEHMRPHPWPTLSEARAEVEESLAPDRISLIATADDGKVVGWVGGIRQYDGNVWELHPLVVSPAERRKGVGTKLVEALEAKVRDHGGLTLWLGSDDVNAQTSLGGVDVYPRPLYYLSNMRNTDGHPYSFYEKLGFFVVGMMPDANGFGKPDIFMAKRVRSLL